MLTKKLLVKVAFLVSLRTVLGTLCVCVTITPFACGCNESNYPNNTDRLVNVFVAARVPRISEGNLNVFRRLI